MKDRVDKSRGSVTLITETLTKIKLTDPSRLDKYSTDQCVESDTDQIPRSILRSNHYPHYEYPRKGNTKCHRILLYDPNLGGVHDKRYKHNRIRQIHVDLEVM
jgi:hypothetical protein